MKIEEMMLRIWENQEELKKDVSEIKVAQAEMKVVLDEHQRRSLANEEAVAILRDQVKPIESHVFLVNTLTKLGLALIGGIVSIISLFQAVEFIIK